METVPNCRAYTDRPMPILRYRPLFPMIRQRRIRASFVPLQVIHGKGLGGQSRNNQKTEVVPPAEVREDCPLIQKSYSLVLFVLAVLAAAHVVSEIVGGFTRVTGSWPRWRQRQL